jgi:diguanylate cyclase (GGDEF)-like protein
VLAGLILLGELFPIQVHGPKGVENRLLGEETFSTPFGFAMLLIFGVPEVVLVQALCSLVADVIGRRPTERVVFNIAQLSLSWAAAGAALGLAGGTGLSSGEALDPEDLVAIALSAAVFFAVNSTLVRTAEALLQEVAILAHLRADLLFRSWSAATLFAIGPLVAVIAEDWLYLVPALALPMAAVHRASKQASEMEKLALYDSLTGLPNRSLVSQQLDRALRTAGAGRRVAVLALGLDRFRDVNDTLGRDQGDALLVEMAERLGRSLRSSDRVARLGGDQFGVLLTGIGGADDAAGAARKILETLSRPLEVADASLSLDASIGIACHPEHGEAAELLLQRAEAAMYRAKGVQSRLELYEPELDDQAPRRLVLVTSLKRAIDAGLIEMHYQPKVELARGRAVGVEALARWSHPQLGPVAPGTFVPLAERTGLVGPLTNLALERALADSRRWRDAGVTLPVAVNVSAKVLLDHLFPEAVGARLAEAGLDGSALEIEITESTLMGDHVQARDALERLRAIGVRASIDDFGTGFSSLAYLRELPVHALKIDRSFIARLAGDPGAEAIVRSIIELARNLGLSTVAEGVEEPGDCDRLAALGCDAVQGFALARPMPSDAMLDWMLSRAAGRARNA